MANLLEEPFLLAQGDSIHARVSQVNEIGQGVPSVVNSFGAVVEQVPHKPMEGPSKNQATTQTSLVVDYKHLVGLENGGSEILSY